MSNKNRVREGPPKFVSDACDMISEASRLSAWDEYLPDALRRAKRGESLQSADLDRVLSSLLGTSDIPEGLKAYGYPRKYEASSKETLLSISWMLIEQQKWRRSATIRRFQDLVFECPDLYPVYSDPSVVFYGSGIYYQIRANRADHPSFSQPVDQVVDQYSRILKKAKRLQQLDESRIKLLRNIAEEFARIPDASDHGNVIHALSVVCCSDEMQQRVYKKDEEVSRKRVLRKQSSTMAELSSNNKSHHSASTSTSNSIGTGMRAKAASASPISHRRGSTSSAYTSAASSTAASVGIVSSKEGGGSTRRAGSVSDISRAIGAGSTGSCTTGRTATTSKRHSSTVDVTATTSTTTGRGGGRGGGEGQGQDTDEASAAAYKEWYAHTLSPEENMQILESLRRQLDALKDIEAASIASQESEGMFWRWIATSVDDYHNASAASTSTSTSAYAGDQKEDDGDDNLTVNTSVTSLVAPASSSSTLSAAAGTSSSSSGRNQQTKSSPSFKPLKATTTTTTSTPTSASTANRNMSLTMSYGHIEDRQLRALYEEMELSLSMFAELEETVGSMVSTGVITLDDVIAAAYSVEEEEEEELVEEEEEEEEEAAAHRRAADDDDRHGEHRNEEQPDDEEDEDTEVAEVSTKKSPSKYSVATSNNGDSSSNSRNNYLQRSAHTSGQYYHHKEGRAGGIAGKMKIKSNFELGDPIRHQLLQQTSTAGLTTSGGKATATATATASTTAINRQSSAGPSSSSSAEAALSLNILRKQHKDILDRAARASEPYCPFNFHYSK